MVKKPCVAVMMSTYNGAKYLCEQIDSILQQKYINVELYIRDDGSTDETLSILKKYEVYDNVHIYSCKNIGVVESFMDLLFTVPKNYNFYAFSDQDDVWLLNKIKVAIDRIGEEDIPKLYFSRKTFVDENLNEIFMNDIHVRDTGIGVALINSFASGCTMVFNQRLHEYLCQYHPKLKSMRLHDAWVCIVAAALGKVVYDRDSYILYRQHGDNITGRGSLLANSWWRRWWHRIRTLKDRRGDVYRSYCAQELLLGYGDKLGRDVYSLVYDLANVRKNYMSRARLIFSNQLKTQKKWEIIFLKIFILFGWI